MRLDMSARYPFIMLRVTPDNTESGRIISTFDADVFRSGAVRADIAPRKCSFENLRM